MLETILPIVVIASVSIGVLYYLDRVLLVSSDLKNYALVIWVIIRTKYYIHYNTQLVDIWEQIVDNNPNKVILIFEGKEYRARELDILVNQIANWAIDLGIQKDDKVGLFMENRPEFIATWLGLAKVGVTTALINTHISDDGLLHCINISDVKYLIFGSELTSAIDKVAPRLQNVKLYSFFDAHKSTTDAVPSYATALDFTTLDSTRPSYSYRKHVKITDPMLMIYTSGTTGLPKAVKIDQSVTLFRSLTVICQTQSTEKDVLYCPLPLYHTSGGVLAVGMMLFTGMTLVLTRKFSASKFWPEVRKHNVTVVQYIGELCRYLLNSPPQSTDRDIKVRIAFGNGLRPDIWSEFQERFDIPVVCEFYGSTEGCVGFFNVCSKKEDQGCLGKTGALVDYITGTTIVKYDIDNDELVTDENGKYIICKPNETGELIGKIRESIPSGKFQGYYGNDKATDKKILQNVFVQGDRYFRTGDLFRRDDERRWYFMDRVGDTFRWKGENVATNEVGEALAQFPRLNDVCVYGVQIPNQDGRACLAAMEFDDTAFDFKSFYEFSSTKLPSYAIPVFLRKLSQMKVTGTMKHEKAKLRKEGMDPKVVADALYYLDRGAKTYLPLTKENYEQVVNNPRL